MLGLPYLPAVAGKHQYLVLCFCTVHRGSAWAGNVWPRPSQICPTAACPYLHPLLSFLRVGLLGSFSLFGIPVLDRGLALICFMGHIKGLDSTSVLELQNLYVIPIVCQMLRPSALQNYEEKGFGPSLCKLLSLVFSQNSTQTSQPFLFYSVYHRWAAFSRLAWKTSCLSLPSIKRADW